MPSMTVSRPCNKRTHILGFPISRSSLTSLCTQNGTQMISASSTLATRRALVLKWALKRTSRCCSSGSTTPSPGLWPEGLFSTSSTFTCLQLIAQDSKWVKEMLPRKLAIPVIVLMKKWGLRQGWCWKIAQTFGNAFDGAAWDFSIKVKSAFRSNIYPWMLYSAAFKAISI